jgi:hypothetical protein
VKKKQYMMVGNLTTDAGKTGVHTAYYLPFVENSFVVPFHHHCRGLMLRMLVLMIDEFPVARVLKEEAEELDFSVATIDDLRLFSL